MLPRSGPLRELATLAAHHAVRRVLPLTLGLRRAMARSGYDRLLVAYRLDFLHQHRVHPEGVGYRLVSAEPVAPGVRAYRLQAPPGVHHQGGDTLLLKWRNAEDEVQALLRLMGWTGAEPVRLRTASSAFTPGRRRRTDAATALREMIDFRAAIEMGAVQPGMPPAEALATWPRLQPRSYSITGIEATPLGERVEILVSDVAHTLDMPGLSGGIDTRTWPGRCSGHLGALKPGVDDVRGWPLAFPLRLRPQPAAPLLVVATGIAAAGPVFELETHEGGPAWLVFGLRHFDLTQPYTRRLVEHAAARPGTRLDIAVSRDAAPDAAGLPPNVHLHGNARVQDVLQAEHARFDRHLRDGGNTVVMGHTSMGAEVQAWLRGRFVAAGLAADAAAATAMQSQLEGALRVQYSLSGR